MISISFALRNPFSSTFEVVREKYYVLSKYKVIEIGLYRTSDIIGAGFHITSLTRDHRGASLDIELLGYRFDFTYYDTRHYGDYE